MKRQPPNILVSIWTTERAVERVTLSKSNTFSYQIKGPHLDLNTFFESYRNGHEAPLPPLNFDPLTPFTKRVLEALTTIPFGKTLTYGELATQIGSPNGARAVGGALGRNPFPLLLPCHRILASNGIGGFSAGEGLKPLLLKHEFLF